MAIQTITQFQTSDGSRFPARRLAEEYERRIFIHRKIVHLLDAAGVPYTTKLIETFAAALLAGQFTYDSDYERENYNDRPR